MPICKLSFAKKHILTVFHLNIFECLTKLKLNLNRISAKSDLSDYPNSCNYHLGIIKVKTSLML